MNTNAPVTTSAAPKKQRNLAIGSGTIFVAALLADYFLDTPPILTFITTAIIIGVHSRANTKERARFMRQFAEENGYAFTPKNMAPINEVGVIFNRGSLRGLWNLIEGNYLGYPLRIFNYSYSYQTGRGARNQQTQRYTVFDLECKAQVSRMYLDCHNGFNGFGAVDGLEKLRLEANEFNKYFTLYITPGKQVEALSIFTPDLMAELLDLPGKYDIEFVNNQMYIYANQLVSSAQTFKNMCGVARHLLANVAVVMEKIKV